MTEQKIQRINELYRLSRQRALTEQEKSEQQTLRREYIDAYKRSLCSQLDNTYIQYPNGERKKLEKK